MADHNSSLVNLSIPKEITQPIVAIKIQEAVMAALGGQEQIISGVIKTICETKVRESDGKKPDYSSDKTVSWIDYNVTKVITDSLKEELKNQINIGSETIKAELVKQLQSKKGASKIAQALLDGFNSHLASGWKSQISIQFLEEKH